MKTNENHHPGRSVDFLSRLHDGELGAGERARFEAHRAHCAECRRAALEFEDALSMFRSARSTPPRADLASRILRKVQSTNRPRVPFPPRFRIDLGWAALLATALLALLIATPTTVRRPEGVPPSPPSDGPAASTLVDEAAPPRVAVDARPALGESKREDRRARPADAKPSRSGAVEEPEKETPEPSDAAARPAERTDSRLAAQSARERTPAKPVDQSRTVAMAPEAGPIGGEGGTVSPLAKAVPLKLAIEPIDGFGPAPELLSRSTSTTAPARGREFIVLVDSQGAVRKVWPQVSRGERSREELLAEGDVGDEIAAALGRLRFEPGNRPRRLLIRVE